MSRANYRHQKRSREDARKVRQAKKLERRQAARAPDAVVDVSPDTAVPTDEPVESNAEQKD